MGKSTDKTLAFEIAATNVYSGAVYSLSIFTYKHIIQCQG